MKEINKQRKAVVELNA